MRRVSLNARDSFNAQSSAEVEVALFHIEHDDLEAPVRLSTDPTVRLSEDPLYYGTRSSWYNSDPDTEPFLFVLAATDLPSDLEDVPAAATIVLENIDIQIAKVLRSFTDRARVSMAVVLSSAPDVVEIEYRGLSLMSANGTAAEITLEISREPIEDEQVPMDRFTKQRFPGLFR